MKILPRLVIACVAAGCATAAAADDRSALYSFNDLYRLTVSGAIPELPASEMPLRAVSEASAEPVSASTEFTFTITPVPGPGRWPLLLAGLAACAWVAHRRLTRPL
jgi:hypothetical protein